MAIHTKIKKKKIYAISLHKIRIVAIYLTKEEILYTVEDDEEWKDYIKYVYKTDKEALEAFNKLDNILNIE